MTIDQKLKEISRKKPNFRNRVASEVEDAPYVRQQRKIPLLVS